MKLFSASSSHLEWQVSLLYRRSPLCFPSALESWLAHCVHFVPVLSLCKHRAALPFSPRTITKHLPALRYVLYFSRTLPYPTCLSTHHMCRSYHTRLLLWIVFSFLHSSCLTPVKSHSRHDYNKNKYSLQLCTTGEPIKRWCLVSKSGSCREP